MPDAAPSRPSRTSPAYPLNPRQRRFVDAYLLEPCARTAAIRAGYHHWNAAQIGYQLLQRPNVAAALAVGREVRAAPLTREMVIEELRRVAFSNLMDYFSLSRHEQKIELDLSQLDHARAAGLRELSIDETYDGRTKTTRRQIRVRMGPKVFALTRLLSLLPSEEPKAPSC
jgi:hypothetical protein